MSAQDYANTVDEFERAEQARALLALFYRDGKFHIKEFIHEMQARSLQAYGKRLTPQQHQLLARIATAYVREREAQS